MKSQVVYRDRRYCIVEIGCSKLLELAQGFEIVTPDPFSLHELGGVRARDYSEPPQT